MKRIPESPEKVGRKMKEVVGRPRERRRKSETTTEGAERSLVRCLFTPKTAFKKHKKRTNQSEAISSTGL